MLNKNIIPHFIPHFYPTPTILISPHVLIFSHNLCAHKQPMTSLTRDYSQASVSKLHSYINDAVDKLYFCINMLRYF